MIPAVIRHPTRLDTKNPILATEVFRIPRVSMDNLKIPNINNLEELKLFLTNEIEKSNPRVGLISVILGCLEDNGGLFPLDITSTYEKYLDFVNGELKPETSNDKRQTLKRFAEIVWKGTKVLKKKRQYSDRYSQIWHFANLQKCNCLAFATVLFDGCRLLEIPFVYIVISEIHVWIGFNDTDKFSSRKGEDYNYPSVYLLDNTVEIMTPDSEIGCEVDEKMSYSWGYQRSFDGNWNAIVCNLHSYISVMIANSIIDEGMKIELFETVKERCFVEKIPCVLVEQARCLKEKLLLERSIQVYIKAIEVSRSEYNDGNVYPYTELANLLVEQHQYEDSMINYCNAAYVSSKYRYIPWDSDLMEEFLLITKTISKKILHNVKYLTTTSNNKKTSRRNNTKKTPMRVGYPDTDVDVDDGDGDGDNTEGSITDAKRLSIEVSGADKYWKMAKVIFKLLIEFYDHLFAWFDQSKKSCPLAWHNQMKDDFLAINPCLWDIDVVDETNKYHHGRQLQTPIVISNPTKEHNPKKRTYDEMIQSSTDSKSTQPSSSSVSSLPRSKRRITPTMLSSTSSTSSQVVYSISTSTSTSTSKSTNEYQVLEKMDRQHTSIPTTTVVTLQTSSVTMKNESPHVSHNQRGLRSVVMNRIVDAFYLYKNNNKNNNTTTNLKKEVQQIIDDVRMQC
eukprot:TRINITY_DN2470_c0_g1_i1.p1 TRINITY_DN2470_c0_g1~~TRINITY_DN2470_c0_g1_i1.p1  ORF type:complete len:677 (+),score=155.54 TRINITY_DN2470_c0_g1_i1:1331-3361(+)